MKNVTINFVLTIIVILIIASFPLQCMKEAKFLEKKLGFVIQKIEERSVNDTEISTAENVIYKVSKGVGVVSSVVEVFLKILGLVTGIYTIIMFVITLIARLVFSTSKGRLLAYRIFMSLEYVLQGVVIFILGALFVNGVLQATGIISFIFLGAQLIFSARNTYSKRIVENFKAPWTKETEIDIEGA